MRQLRGTERFRADRGFKVCGRFTHHVYVPTKRVVYTHLLRNKNNVSFGKCSQAFPRNIHVDALHVRAYKHGAAFIGDAIPSLPWNGLS